MSQLGWLPIVATVTRLDLNERAERQVAIRFHDLPIAFRKALKNSLADRAQKTVVIPHDTTPATPLPPLGLVVRFAVAAALLLASFIYTF